MKSSPLILILSASTSAATISHWFLDAGPAEMVEKIFAGEHIETNTVPDGLRGILR